MPAQDSTTDQLTRAIGLCNHAGLYDAADWLRREVQRQRVHNADCRQCRDEALQACTDFIAVGMMVCRICGNERCPKATNHRNDCTDSNEAGQAGSAYIRLGPRP